MNATRGLRCGTMHTLGVLALGFGQPTELPAQALTVMDTATGVTLAVHEGYAMPALRIQLPGASPNDSGILVLFPEHVTVVPHGTTTAIHAYLFRPDARGPRPAWRLVGRSLEYELDLSNGLRLTAQATLAPDGVRYRYVVENSSAIALDNVQVVTDPRLKSPRLRDVRLARTYVHHPDGFALLAAETPERLTMPLEQWLPNRYRVPFSWPVDSQRIARQPDGITWYNASRGADEPFIATTSVDGAWVIATFSHAPGNLWTNPELTCQHADPAAALAAHGRVVLEEKTLVLQGTLGDALERIRRQHATLQP